MAQTYMELNYLFKNQIHQMHKPLLNPGLGTGEQKAKQKSNYKIQFEIPGES